jgi:DNA polymerase III alpha subunit
MVDSTFVHLRTCSGYSFKYGTATADQLVERASEFGMRSLGLTDRDNMAGAIRFVQACESASIKPILGINLSFIQRKYRITLLATADGRRRGGERRGVGSYLDRQSDAALGTGCRW